MRSPPGSLLYSDRLLFTIPHCLRIYGLIVTPGELGASHQIFDTLVAVGLVESVAVPVESDGGGPGSVQK